MNILHINTYNTGGAAKACLRLHQGLLKAGVNSNVLLLYKTSSMDEKTVDFRDHFGITWNVWKKFQNKLIEIKNRMKLPLKSNQYEFFSFPWSCWDITKHPLYKGADIIHLHWVAGFMDYRTFFEKCNKKIVWTLHDMNPWSGGFHYEYGFDTTPFHTIARKNIDIKKNALTNKNIHVVAPSAYMANISKANPLFKNFPVSIIRNGLDTDVYKARNKAESRKKLSLSPDKNIILFVSDIIHYKRKGFYIMEEAFRRLSIPDVILCVIGNTKGGGIINGNNIHNLGIINNDDIMSYAYSAADVLVCPSMDEALGYTAMESLCCGTPVLAFKAGGLPEIITGNDNGILCEEKNADSLVNGIKSILSLKFDHAAISENARKKYSCCRQAEKYLKIYNSLL